MGSHLKRSAIYIGDSTLFASAARKGRDKPSNPEENSRKNGRQWNHRASSPTVQGSDTRQDSHYCCARTGNSHCPKRQKGNASSTHCKCSNFLVLGCLYLKSTQCVKLMLGGLLMFTILLTKTDKSKKMTILLKMTKMQ